ncbi:NAD-dependent epimerase/dehydratase family protein [Candidatus Bathyarchaeota archaeon]|nr:NAD-dependent epimerase/dehydratase family protein [Candidatus Bathyarchaeota archaeon]
MKRLMVTGSTGQIGSELTLALRREYGGDNVLAIGHNRKPSGGLLNSGPFEIADVGEKERIEDVVKKYDIDTIYHLVALMSAKGEQNPQLAWKLNMESLNNVLEIARERELARIFWPSSIGVFGPSTPRIETPQETVLLPTTIYGVTKVAGELLCNYYFQKYNVDVRSIRFPGIISSETPPGGGTTDYAVEIFYEAIKRKRYTCFLSKDTVLPFLYMPDCIKAAIDLMRTPLSQVKRHDGYNVSGTSFSPGQLALEITKYVPEFRCDYRPDFRQKIADSWTTSMDDSQARKDWGWKPDYDLSSLTKDMLERLSKRFAEGKT